MKYKSHVVQPQGKIKKSQRKIRIRGILVTRRVVRNEMEGFLLGVFDRVFLRIF